MSRNIKEIGKELMGKSLNSFHRKTGLTQLEENNKMQDGILDGILSQVDDAYIEKTEQSNVIHLDGSGDGVVVLDSIDGNTMVNLAPNSSDINILGANGFIDIPLLKTLPIGTVTTIIFTSNQTGVYGGYLLNSSTWSDQFNSYSTNIGLNKILLTTTNEITTLRIRQNGNDTNIKNLMVLEGDWISKEVPLHFEGLQSSFEEQVEDDKYKIEILLNNKNLINSNDFILGKYVDQAGVLQNCSKGYENYGYIPFVKVKEEFQYTLSPLNTGHYDGHSTFRIGCYDYSKQCIGVVTVNKNTTHTFTTPKNTKYIQFTCTKEDLKTVSLSYGNKTENIDYKHNKIKLLLNEPLRAIDDLKDRLCVKDGELVVERNLGQVTFTGDENWQDNWQNSNKVNSMIFHMSYEEFGKYAKQPNRNKTIKMLSETFSKAYCNSSVWTADEDRVAVHGADNKLYFQVSILKSKLSTLNTQGFKSFIKSKGNINFVYLLAEPYYEEVLNEYGEPIILEGYENGTLYIDSTIVPTTTVRYTPKMESFKTLNEVNNNNIMLTNDVNDNIIPYMMDVDLMIMEKEMALMSHKNIRTIGVKDMTSMQKRTQDMLTRLIKGKTLTEQECKTRVVTYLDAGKITDAQADELMLLISEVYA